MKRSKFTEKRIIGILPEQDAGAKTAKLRRRHGISIATFYAWTAKFSGMEVFDAKRPKALEDEDARLKRLLAGSLLDQAGWLGRWVPKSPLRAAIGSTVVLDRGVCAHRV